MVKVSPPINHFSQTWFKDKMELLDQVTKKLNSN